MQHICTITHTHTSCTIPKHNSITVPNIPTIHMHHTPYPCTIYMHHTPCQIYLFLHLHTVPMHHTCVPYICTIHRTYTPYPCTMPKAAGQVLETLVLYPTPTIHASRICRLYSMVPTTHPSLGGMRAGGDVYMHVRVYVCMRVSVYACVCEQDM